MCTNPHHGPIHGRLGVWKGRFLTETGPEEVVGQMRVGTTVTAALDERQVLGVLDHSGELLDGLRQSMGIVRDVHTPRDLRLRQAACVNNRQLTFHLLPLEALLATVDVKALAVLPGYIPQAASYFRNDI